MKTEITGMHLVLVHVGVWHVGLDGGFRSECFLVSVVVVIIIARNNTAMIDCFVPSVCQPSAVVHFLLQPPSPGIQCSLGLFMSSHPHLSQRCVNG